MDIMDTVSMTRRDIFDLISNDLNDYGKSYRIIEEHMQDIFLRLLVNSDPLVSSLRKLPKKPMRQLSLEAMQLLVEPEVCESSEDEEYPETVYIEGESDEG